MSKTTKLKESKVSDWKLLPSPHISFNKQFTYAIFVWHQQIFLIGGNPFINNYAIATQKWKPSLNFNIPPRTNFTFMSTAESFFIYGGRDGQKYYDDLWKLDPMVGQTLLSTSNIGQRQNAVGIAHQVFDKLILIGGQNSVKKEFYSDINVYNLITSTWCKIISKGETFFPRIQFSLNLFNEKAILFGGMEPSRKYFKDLYQLRIQGRQQIDIIVDKVNSEGPQQRAGHSSCSFNRSQMLIVGGHTLRQNNIVALSDCWVYQTNKKIWHRLQNSQLRPRFNMALGEGFRQIYAFGGLNNLTSEPYKDFYKFQLQEGKHINILYEKLKVSCCFLRRVSELLPSACHAIGLIIDSAELLQSKQIRINLVDCNLGEKSHKFNRRLQIQFQGNMFQISDFFTICKKFQLAFSLVRDQKVKMFANFLKVGAFRLGSTFLFVQKIQNFVRVALFSYDSNMNPDPEGDFHSFHYYQNLETGDLSYQNQLSGKRNDRFVASQIKKIIWNFIGSFYSESNIRQGNNRYTIQIFDLKMEEDLKNYQIKLIDNQICTADSQFVKSFPQSWQSKLSFSLNTYLNLHHYSHKMNVFFKFCSLEMCFTPSAKRYVQHFIQHGKIKRLQSKTDKFQRIQSIQLFSSLSEEFKYPGILVYSNNRLVLNLKSNSLRELPALGILKLKQDMRPNMLRIGMEQSWMQEQIEMSIYQYLNGSRVPAKTGVSVITLEE